MVRQVRVEVLSDARKYRPSKQVEAENKRIVDHTRRASGALKAAFATFSAGAVIIALKSTVDAASATNETVSKTKVVFGPAAKAVEDFSKRAATSMGLSRQEAMESAATFGNLFVSMKIGAPKAAEMSTKMVQLAGDLASFNNANPQETLEALRSGLVGETEPLRRFGINLNDADLRQKALSLGLVKTTKEVLPPAVKAQAAYALILEQSKTAQGDFARTSGGLANQQRILAAKVKDLQASIGSVLLPVVLKGVSAFNLFLGVVDRNKTAFGVLFGVLGTGAAILGTLIVAEKIHKTVTEGIEIATKAWSATQKGLNVVLGITRVQAATTATSAAALATAENGAATATAAWGTATVATSRSLGASIGLISGAAVAATAIGLAIDKATERFGRWQGAVELAGLAVAPFGIAVTGAKKVLGALTGDTDKHSTATHKNALETAYAAQQTELQRQAMVAAIPQFQTAADKTRLNAEAISTLSGKLGDLRGQLGQARDSMAQTIQSYDGLISKSKVTASEVVKDLRNQVANFRTYAHDSQTLIKKGVDPAAIRELSQKGPEYVHALATGSNRQLGQFNRDWVTRNRERNGAFARAMDAQYQGLVKKIQAMQREINKLKGKTVTVGVQGTIHWDKNAALLKSLTGNFTHKLPLFSGGGRITAGTGPTADDVLIRASRKETIVSAADSERPEFQAWASARGIPGFARGGALWTYSLPMRNAAADAERYATRAALNSVRQIHIAKRTGLIPGAPGNVSGAVALGKALAAQMGWIGAQWNALYQLWQHESGWRWNADNPTSSAYGIPQALPGSKMGSVAADWRTNPRTQILWGLGYIKGRYGSPGNAWNFWLGHSPHWYDQGGMLPTGTSVAVNRTGRPEPVGFDYDRMAEANVRAMKAAGLGAVYLDGRRVDRQQATAQVLNARRR